jgi:type II secretory pathway pseudopilin PulG
MIFSDMKFAYHSQTARGFTLIEVLVYISVFVMVALGAVLALVSYGRIVETVKTQAALSDAGQGTLERITRALRSGDSINVSNSSFATTSGSIAVVTGIDEVRFYRASGTIFMRTNSGSPVALVDDSLVYVDKLVFFSYQSAEDTELIRIELQLSASSSEAVLTRTFNAATMVRGTYQ